MAVVSSWVDGRLACLDFETTAADPEDARIVTAAIAVVGGGLATDTVTLMADPGIEIPDEAAAIHGITTERARAEGLPADDVVNGVLCVLRPYVEQGVPLAIFNARYDLTVLDREARRYGLQPLDPWRVLDPWVIDKHTDRYRRGSRKLVAMCAHYGVRLDAAHDAGSDAIAAGRLAWVLGKRGGIIRRVRDHQEADELIALQREWAEARGDLDLLHAAQARWAREQAVGLAEHFRASGSGDPDEVRPEWPVIPALPWECSCGERRLELRYGGLGDHGEDPESPCEPCVMRSFAEFG